MAEVTITTWLSENLMIDWNRNTSLDDIISRLTEDIPAFKDVCNPAILTFIIMKIFPNVKKLMTMYQDSLPEPAQKELTAALQHISFLVSFFSDSRPVKYITDERLRRLTLAYDWFKSWVKQVAISDSVNKRYNTLMTMEKREDLDFMYHGFISLTKLCVSEIGQSIFPSRINSDIAENVFCQQRYLYHGAATNPACNSYRTGKNFIVLGQATISRKSNSGGKCMLILMQLQGQLNFPKPVDSLL